MGLPVIIYHDNCPDGWAAAWWLGKFLGPHIKHPGRYGEDPPWKATDGNDVYIVDFCYPALTLWEVMRRSQWTTVLDHHQTAAEDILVDGFGGTDTMTAALMFGQAHGIVIDQDRSGVGLVSDYVRSRWADREPNTPPFLAHIEDRDLWRFDLEDTKDVFAAVTSRPYTVEAWDELGLTSLPSLVAEGKGINRYRDRLIDQVSASTFGIVLPVDDGTMLVPCSSSPYAIGSDVAGRLAERDGGCGVGAYVILHADHVQLGLRSTPNGPDVARIAEGLGGGGHQHASGLKLSWAQFAASIDDEINLDR